MESFFVFVSQNFTLSLFIISFLVTIYVFLTNEKNASWDFFFKTFLSFFVLFNIGVSFILNFILHVFFGESIAAFIGWSQSPFQAEVGFASLGFGIVGLISFWGNYSQKLVSIIGPSFFLLGAALGHIYQFLFYHNLAPGNVGIVLATDLFIPVLGLYLLWKNKKYSKS